MEVVILNKLRNLIRLDFMLTNAFKFNCTVLLSLIAIALFIINPTREQKICMYAILVSTIADLILMDYNNIPGIIFKNNHFYVGMLFFAITHILYICCFSKMVMVRIFILSYIISALILSVLVMSMSILLWFKLVDKKRKIFKIASFMYMLIIDFDLMVIFICSDLLKNNLVFAAIGITMFLISDMLILIRETVCDNNIIRKTICFFYPLGQLFIMCSVYC